MARMGYARKSRALFDSKVILGIAVPLFIIVLLVLISSIGAGFSVSTETTESLAIKDLFYNSRNYSYSALPPYALVQTITVTNDNLLPRRYELPKLVACLKGKTQSEAIIQQSMDVVYVPADKATKIKSVPIVDDIAGVSYSNVYFNNYNRYDTLESVEVPLKGSKQVNVYVVPKGLYDYDPAISEYGRAEELVLVEAGSGAYYNFCRDWLAGPVAGQGKQVASLSIVY